MRSYRDCHLLGMSNCRSSNFTAICWATSEIVHHFDNNGFRSRETLKYIICSGIWGPTRHLSLKITNYLAIFRVRKPLKSSTRWSTTGLEPGTSRRQIFHSKRRNQGCNFTRDEYGVVASRCFPHLTLYLAFEQTLKDHRDNNVEVRRVDLAILTLRTSPKFITGVKYQFHQGFWPDLRSGYPKHPSLPL